MIREIFGLSEAQNLLRRLGVDAAGVGIMAKKMVQRIIYIRGLSMRAANILKQECLAAGAELALPKEAALLRGTKTDAVLIGTLAQLEHVLLVLKAQPFGLRAVGEEIRGVLASAALAGARAAVSGASHGKVGGGVARGLARPQIMGVINVTPDSFSDGGSFFVGGKVDVKNIMRAIAQMVDDGADVIDIGGESTGPGSVVVTAREEMARLRPVFDVIARGRFGKNLGKRFGGRARFSIDTYKSDVARAALQSGFSMVNDVTALRGDRKMARVVASSRVGDDVSLVLMYAKDATARTTRRAVRYDDVIETVADFLSERIDVATRAGIARERILIDPGMGAFVSSEPKYSLELLRRLRELSVLGCSIVVGPSRKSFIGQILDVGLDERLEGSIAAAVVAYLHGASMVRVHDVRATRRALDMAYAVLL